MSTARRKGCRVSLLASLFNHFSYHVFFLLLLLFPRTCLTLRTVGLNLFLANHEGQEVFYQSSPPFSLSKGKQASLSVNPPHTGNVWKTFILKSQMKFSTAGVIVTVYHSSLSLYTSHLLFFQVLSYAFLSYIYLKIIHKHYLRHTT